MADPIREQPQGDLMNPDTPYACVYCGLVFGTYDDPSVIICCDEVGHVEPCEEEQ